MVRVDAPNDNCPSGTFVTVESGPHKTLERSLMVLRRGLERAHVQPDIVFLPRNTPVVALNETVPAAPRLVVRAASVVQARRCALLCVAWALWGHAVWALGAGPRPDRPAGPN